MTVLAAIYALFVQMSGSLLNGDAWTDKFLDYTYQNVVAIEQFFWDSAMTLGALAFGALALSVVLLVMNFAFASNRGRRTIWALFSGLAFSLFMILIIIAGLVLLIWLIGLLHVLVVGYLAANFTVVGPLNPGFWIVVVLLILFSWS